MATNVLPSFEAGTWDHEASQMVDLWMQAMVDPARVAAPTFQLLWNNMKYADINSDGTFQLPVDLSINPAIYGNVHMVYNTEHSEETTKAVYRPGIMYTGNAISELELRGEYRDITTLVSEVETRQKAMNKGLTIGQMYELWAKTGYTTIGGVAAEPAGTEIDISAIMTNIYLNATIKNKPTLVSQRIASIPSICKPDGAGHTYAGIDASNAWWRPKVFYASGTDSILEINATNGYAEWCVDVPSDNVDLVTDPTGDTGGGGGGKLFEWEWRTIDLWLDQMQQGGGYELYIAVPPTGYSAMVEFARDNTQASPNEQFMDLGITSNFRHSSYNATFYSDPTMSATWPNSMFAYDPESLFFCAVNDTCPLIKGWQEIPGSTSVVAAKILRYQLVCTNPLALGAFHGINWG